MLKKFLNWQLSLCEEGKPLQKFKPMIQGLDTFLFEPDCKTKGAPHVRDAVDLKRWMSIVVAALFPCIFMAIWNTGLQKMVYACGDYHLMDEYLKASHSFSTYIDFVAKDQRYWQILWLGAKAFLPIMMISYAVGGFWEVIFACIRKHEIAEGFLVSGMLYALILPPTIPYWMVAVGVSAGIVIGKELFGGTGMNIFNPAMVCRCFLFFTFPGKMTGDVWAGTNPTIVAGSLKEMNHEAGKSVIDAYSQATPLKIFNISTDVKRVHVEAIAANRSLASSHQIGSNEVIQQHLQQWNQGSHAQEMVSQLNPEQLQRFVTDPISTGGLGLAPENYEAAYRFTDLQYAVGTQTDGNFFWGNILGSMGETSTFACLVGAVMMIYMGVAAWRTIVSVLLGTFIFATLFEWGAHNLGVDSGAWNAAKYAFPAYKHLLLGSVVFGAVFMATDPVSSPGFNISKWIYGLLIGLVVVVIRVVNPAYPEGVMLAILFGNAFAPLIDRMVLAYKRRGYNVSAS